MNSPRKLTDEEGAALYYLERDGPITPGARFNSSAGFIVKIALDGLVRKKYATVELTDDGPRYSITPLGSREAGR